MMKNIKVTFLSLLFVLGLSTLAHSQVVMVNSTDNVYEFKYKFKGKKTAKVERILTRKLGTPKKIKKGKKIVWKTDTTKAKLKRGKIKFKHKGGNPLKWKVLKTRISLIG
ncbi:MAG: hypothetical protein AAF806_19670 [Bacteroidota bacterium]